VSQEVQGEGMMHLGVDPGQSGAIAVVFDSPVSNRAAAVALAKMTEKDIYDYLQEMGERGDVAALIEQVHSMPGQGVVSSFKFGVSYGGLRMALIAAGIPFEAVTPQKWKAAIGLAKKKGEGNTDYKNRSKARAQELFPQLTITHANAEALLLAWYGGRR
jgi:hypothetical protein